MVGNVSRHPARNVTFAPFVTIDPEERARERARRPPRLRVQFAEFELPDTPENNLIIRPVTRRWAPRFVDSSDSTDEGEVKDEVEDIGKDLEAKPENLEMDSNLEIGNFMGTVVSQQPTGSSSKTTITSADIDIPLDASELLIVSHHNHTSGISPDSCAATMSRSTPKNSMQPNRTPAAALSTSHSPAPLALSGNKKLGESIPHKTPTPDRAMTSRPSPLSRGSPKASSGTRGRVYESIQNGKRRVEIDLLSDDEDDGAFPSQRTSTPTSQRSAKPRRMAPSTIDVYSATQGALKTPDTIPALRLSEPTALQRRLFTKAPQASFILPQAPSQGRQPQSKTVPIQHQVLLAHAHAARVPRIQAKPGHAQDDALQAKQNPAKGTQALAHNEGTSLARQASPGLFVQQPHDKPAPPALIKRSCDTPDPIFKAIDPEDQHGMPLIHQAQQTRSRPISASAIGSSPAVPTRPTRAPGSKPSACPLPDINVPSQAQRGQGTVGAEHLVTEGPCTSYQPTFGKLFHPPADAKIGDICAQAGTENTTGNMIIFWDVATGVQEPFMTEQKVKKDLAGMKRPDDDSGALANYPRFKKQEQGVSTNNGSRPGGIQNGSLFTSQEKTNRSSFQSAAAPFPPGHAASKATGLNILGQQSAQSNIDNVPAPQQQTRPATIFSNMGPDHNKFSETGLGPAMYPNFHHQNRLEYSPARRNHNKSVTSRGEGQFLRERIHVSAVQVEDDVDDVGDELVEYPQDYSDGDDGYAPTKNKSKLRAWDKGRKKLRTETLSRKPSRVGTHRMPSQAFHLFQPPKDPSVAQGKDFFSPLPLELRRRIYRELLKAKDSIAVLNGWSQIYRHQQLDLHPAILGVDKKHNADANVVLYGDNVFRYILRDDAKMVEFEAGKKRKDERTMPLKKQVDNLRYLELEVEPNRIDVAATLAFYAALEILVKNKATKLFRLTIDLSPRLQKGVQGKKGMTNGWISQRVWFTKAQGITDMLKQLRAHFVFFDIHLEEKNGSKAISLRTIVDLRPEISDTEMLAELERHSDRLKSSMRPEARRALARERVEERLEAEAYKKLDMMSTRLEQAVRKDPASMTKYQWFEFEPKRKQRKTIQASDDALEGE